MNLLYNVDKFYIMGNHLAAAWCWAQKIGSSKKYGLFHIGKGSTSKQTIFSNEAGSNCSSLGYYKITGKHRMNIWGLPSFKLGGLDKNNSSAEKKGDSHSFGQTDFKFPLGM